MNRYAMALAMGLMVALMAHAQVPAGTMSPSSVADAVRVEQEPLAHGGGLNACGCHFNRKTGDCHCHRPRACGCACQPPSCAVDAAPTDAWLNEESFSAMALPPTMKNRELPGFR